MEGVVTIVQESRFQLLDDEGVAHHFVLAYTLHRSLSSFRHC